MVWAWSGSGGGLKLSWERYARRSRLIGFSGSQATYSRMMRRSSSARSRIPIASWLASSKKQDVEKQDLEKQDLEKQELKK
jgi:hypothetical protein